MMHDHPELFDHELAEKLDKLIDDLKCDIHDNKDTATIKYSAIIKGLSNIFTVSMHEIRQIVSDLYQQTRNTVISGASKGLAYGLFALIGTKLLLLESLAQQDGILGWLAKIAQALKPLAEKILTPR
jgi:hypothetical protein